MLEEKLRINLIIFSCPSLQTVSKAHFSEEEYDEFMSVYPEIRQDITSTEPYNKLPYFMDKIKTMLDYNVTTGNNARGLITVYAYKMIAKTVDQTPENIRLAILLGWCMRLVSAD